MKQKLLQIVLLCVSLNTFALDQQLEIEYISVDGSSDVVNTIYENEYYYDSGDSSVAVGLRVQKSNNKYYNYLDLKEFYYNYEQETYEFKVGFDTVFWGITESYNPVDVVNQKNNLSSANKPKLSEAMVSFNYFFDEDSIELLYLPHFREQEFTTFDIAHTTFEDKKDAFAFRYKGILDNLDYGVSYFNGVSREPRFIVANNQLSSHYQNVEQSSIDIQLTTENVLWKLEYAHQKHQASSDDVFVAGFEYLLGSEIEANILVEVLQHTNEVHIFADDIMLGLRVNLNNEESSEGLFSIIYDRNYHSKVVYMNVNQRIFSDYKLDISARYGFNKHADNNIKNFQNQLGIKVSYYF